MNEVPNMITGMSGWICPKCGRVYSPYTSMCLYCSKEGNTQAINRTTPTPVSKLSETMRDKLNEARKKI